MTCSDGLDLLLGACAAGFDFSAGVGSMYTWSSKGATGSGYLVAWVVAVGVLGWDCGAGEGIM